MEIPEQWLDIRPSEKNQNSLVVYGEDTAYSVEDFIINYISDLHLDHKIQSMLREKDPRNLDVLERIQEYLFNLALDIGLDRRENVFHFTLFAGDTSFRRGITNEFYGDINTFSQNPKEVVAVLGNHEFWEYDRSIPLDEYIEDYKNHVKGTVLHNEILFAKWYPRGNWHKRHTYLDLEIVPYNMAITMPDDKLRELFESSLISILGGTGFAGYDEVYNADTGMYNGALTRSEELQETIKFESLYKRVRSIASDIDVIILTHMPKHCWSRDPYVPGWRYINGHTHMNYISDENGAIILSNNQIGYYRDKDSIRLKNFTLGYGYDLFKDYADGIHEIDRDRFVKFHNGRGIVCEMNRPGTIWMIKHNGYYLFILESDKGTLYNMKGGSIKKAEHQNLDYYIENLPRYVSAMESFLEPYMSLQRRVSNSVKAFNGSGRIHGCIVDIDYYNHLYVNPFDGSVTPYFAKDTTNKWVYDNVQALLFDHSKELYDRYIGISEEDAKSVDENALVIRDPRELMNVKGEKYEGEEMYTYSRLIYSLQRIKNSKLIRIWNDDVLKMSDLEYVREHIEGFLPEGKNE